MGRVYQLLPTLVEVTENQAHRHSAQASATLVQLASFLHQETLARPQDRTCEPSSRLSPGAARARTVGGALRRAPAARDHRRLSAARAADQRHLPEDPEGSVAPLPSTGAQLARVRAPWCRFWSCSPNCCTTRAFPPAALKIVAERLDRKFLDYLLHNIGSPVSLRVLDNLRKSETVGWLSRRTRCAPGTRRPGPVGGDRNRQGRLRRSRHVLVAAEVPVAARPAGRPPRQLRRAGRFPRPLCRSSSSLDTLNDPDPRVQAAAVRQLRHRGIHDAMERLVALLDHRAAEVRDAARSSLAEFNFSRYRGAFDSMDEATRQKIGRLVAKVDPTSIAPAGGTAHLAVDLDEIAGPRDGAGDGRGRRGVRSAGAAGLRSGRRPSAPTPSIALGTCRRADAMPLLYEAENDANPMRPRGRQPQHRANRRSSCPGRTRCVRPRRSHR